MFDGWMVWRLRWIYIRISVKKICVRYLIWTFIEIQINVGRQYFEKLTQNHWMLRTQYKNADYYKVEKLIGIKSQNMGKW